MRPLALLAFTCPLWGQTYLNHFYVNVDSKTYAAIGASEVLKNEFAVFEKRTTVRKDRTYTGLYFYGVNTYFEFFDLGAKQSPTHSGIAFGVEKLATLEATQALWKAAGKNSTLETITREYEGESLPWFVSLTLASLSPAQVFRSWMMEYVPSFASSWHPELGGRPTLARRDVLALYAQSLGVKASDRLFSDVTSLTVALPPAEEADFLTAAREMGLRVEGKRVLGADIDIVLAPFGAGRRGILEMRMRLSKKLPATREILLGDRSRMTLRADGTGQWIF